MIQVNRNFFSKHTKEYNSCCQITAFGAENIVKEYYLLIFKIQGQIYNRAESELALPNAKQLLNLGMKKDKVSQNFPQNYKTLDFCKWMNVAKDRYVNVINDRIQSKIPGKISICEVNVIVRIKTK